MLRTDHIRRLAPGGAVALVAAALAEVLLDLGVRVEIVMKAAGIPKNASGIGGFVNGAHALVTPALVMVAGGRAAGVDRRRGGVDVRRAARDADRRHVARRAAAAGQRHGADRLARDAAAPAHADRLSVPRAGRGRAVARRGVGSCWRLARACWRSTLAVSALEPSPAQAWLLGLPSPGPGDQRPAGRDRACDRRHGRQAGGDGV